MKQFHRILTHTYLFIWYSLILVL